MLAQVRTALYLCGVGYQWRANGVCGIDKNIKLNSQTKK